MIFFSDSLFFLSYTLFCFFFFNDTATTEIYTLSLHDALPISSDPDWQTAEFAVHTWDLATRSEEHTSELQSRGHIVCRLLLEKKKNNQITMYDMRKKNHRNREIDSYHTK